MEAEFELETILSVVYRQNITSNYNNILDLYSFMFNMPNISMTDFFRLYEIGREHILKLYPEMDDRLHSFDPLYVHSYVQKQKQRFGNTLTISTFGTPIMNLKKQVN